MENIQRRKIGLIDVVGFCLLVFLVALAGCATRAPSILEEMKNAPAATHRLSDAAIVAFWAQSANKYGAAIQYDEWLSMGGRLTVAALATATVALAARGNSAVGTAAAGAAILSWLGIIQPKERATTYALARSKLGEALGLYVVERSGAARTVPTNCVSGAGAKLFLETMRITGAADLTIIGAWPDDPKPEVQRAKERAIQEQSGCQ